MSVDSESNNRNDSWSNGRMDSWELRALDRFATKAHVREVETRMISIDRLVAENTRTVARIDITMKNLATEMRELKSILTRIAWILVTPILAGAGAAILWGTTLVQGIG